MQNPKSIAESFRQLDFHDATVVCLQVLPPQSRNGPADAMVEIRLLQQNKERVLRFIGCGNLRVGMDFDVMAHNFPANTSQVDAHTDKDAMWSLMQSQTGDWAVKYAADMSNPLDKKSAVMNEFVCFRVQFCGGVTEIIARRYEIEDIEK